MSKNVDAAEYGYLLRAIEHYLVQDLESAMADAEKAVAKNGNDWAAYLVRAFVRFHQLETPYAGAENQSRNGDATLPNLDYRLVKSDLDKVVELAPDFAHAYYNRANVAVKLSDFRSAIVDYTKAIELDDRLAMAYYNRGLAKIYTGNAESGVADLSKAGELGLFHAYSVMKRFMHSAKE